MIDLRFFGHLGKFLARKYVHGGGRERGGGGGGGVPAPRARLGLFRQG